MRMTESGAFQKFYRQYKKHCNSAEGQQLLANLHSQEINDYCLSPHDETELGRLQAQYPGRVFFDTICPSCGKRNTFSVPDDYFSISGYLSMRALCSCGRLYPLFEHIIKELPWAALGCFAFIGLSTIITILFFII